MTAIRIGNVPPVSPPTANAATMVPVLQAPPGLTVPDSGSSFAGIVVARGDGQIEVATDAGVFVLRTMPGISPGMRVILTPEQEVDGIVARLQWSEAASCEGPMTAAPIGASRPDATPTSPRYAEPTVTLDLSASASPAANFIGQRLLVEILAPESVANSGRAPALLSPSPQTPPAPVAIGDIAIRILAVTASSASLEPKPEGSAKTYAAVVAAWHPGGTVLRADDGPVLLLPPNIDLSEGSRISLLLNLRPQWSTPLGRRPPSRSSTRSSRCSGVAACPERDR